MRIIGYIEHPILKISVFKMEHKFSVKFESGLAEQVYKFKASDNIQYLTDIQRIINKDFIKSVEQILESMHQLRASVLLREAAEIQDEFETII